MLALEAARESSLGHSDDAWALQRVLVDHLADTLAGARTTGSGRSVARSSTSRTPA